MHSRLSGNSIARVEALEPRLLLSGNVTVQVDHGRLEVNGGAAANQITIERTDAGQYRVSAADADTTINGQAGPQLFEGIKGLRIDMGRGGDKLVLTGLLLARSVQIDMGDGNDDLKLSDSTIGGSLRVRLGDGNDTFLAQLTRVGFMVSRMSFGQSQISMASYTSTELPERRDLTVARGLRNPFGPAWPIPMHPERGHHPDNGRMVAPPDPVF